MPLSNLKLNYISGMMFLIFLFYMVSCHKTPAVNQSVFDNDPTQKVLDPQSIDEASGIADSRINRGHIWVQEDSGNPPQLFLVSHEAKVKKNNLSRWNNKS